MDRQHNTVLTTLNLEEQSERFHPAAEFFSYGVTLSGSRLEKDAQEHANNRLLRRNQRRPAVPLRCRRTLRYAGIEICFSYKKRQVEAIFQNAEWGMHRNFATRWAQTIHTRIVHICFCSFSTYPVLNPGKHCRFWATGNVLCMAVTNRYPGEYSLCAFFGASAFLRDSPVSPDAEGDEGTGVGRM